MGRFAISKLSIRLAALDFRGGALPESDVNLTFPLD